MGHMIVTRDCIEAGPCCTLQLQEELSQISFKTLHSISKTTEYTEGFWYFVDELVTMLDKQVCHDYLHCDESVTNEQ